MAELSNELIKEIRLYAEQDFRYPCDNATIIALCTEVLASREGVTDAWVLVPREPTDAQLDEAEKGADLVHLMQFGAATRRLHFRLVYAKMLTAALHPQEPK